MYMGACVHGGVHSELWLSRDKTCYLWKLVHGCLCTCVHLENRWALSKGYGLIPMESCTCVQALWELIKEKGKFHQVSTLKCSICNVLKIWPEISHIKRHLTMTQKKLKMKNVDICSPMLDVFHFTGFWASSHYPNLGTVNSTLSSFLL